MLGLFRKILFLREKSVAPKEKSTCFSMIDHLQEAGGRSSRSGWPIVKKRVAYQRMPPPFSFFRFLHIAIFSLQTGNETQKCYKGHKKMGEKRLFSLIFVNFATLNDLKR